MKIFVSTLFCLLLLGPLSSSAAPTLDQASMDIYNTGLQALFTKGYPQLKQQMISEIDATLNDHKVLKETNWLRITISSWGAPEFPGFDASPGIIVDNYGDLTIKAPLTGSWGVTIPNVKIKIETYITITWPFRWRIKIGERYVYVTLGMKDIALEQGLRITGEDNGKIDVDNVSEPDFNFNVVIAGSSFNGSDELKNIANINISSALYDLFLASLGPLGTHIDYYPLEPEELMHAANHPLTPVGGAAEPYDVTPVNPDLEAIVMSIDDKIIGKNMPNGVVYEVFSDVAAYDSWEDAFKPGGAGSPGSHDLSLTTDDSAIWTGTYLAALAYRYKVMGDQTSKSYVAKALKGIEALFAVHQYTGLLARSAAPLDSTVGQQIESYATSKKHYFVFDNETWIGQDGTHGITRDQYTGVLFGLRTAYDLVDDQDIRDRIKYLVTITLDYLLDEDWIITEDRDTPVPFNTVPNAKIVFLTIGNHVTGGRYEQALNEAYGPSNMAWLSTAVSSLQPLESYYGWNLFYTNMLSYFAIEKNTSRREKMMESVRIADYYIGHHVNAWFNLVRASYDENKRREYLEQAMEILKLRLKGGHRHFVPSAVKPLVYDIVYEDVDFPMETSLISLPTQPIHPALRVFGEFVWQRNPYKLYESENPLLEQIGGDISLVYWMLRSEGYAMN